MTLKPPFHTARLEDRNGISYVVNNGSRRPATPVERQLFPFINGELGALEYLVFEWGYVLAGHGDWFDDPAKCREVAAALQGRARGLEGSEEDGRE